MLFRPSRQRAGVRGYGDEGRRTKGQLRTQVLGNADDRLGEGCAAGGSQEGGVTEGEDSSIRGDQPVAPPARRGGGGHDRLGEGCAAGGSQEGGVTEGEDSSIRGDQPVAPPARR